MPAQPPSSPGQNYTFPEKSAGNLMTDQDLMVAVTLWVPTELPVSSVLFGDGSNGWSIRWTNVYILAS